jgi:hypothetical protein
MPSGGRVPTECPATTIEFMPSAMSPEEFRAAAHQAVDWMADGASASAWTETARSCPASGTAVVAAARPAAEPSTNPLREILLMAAFQMKSLRLRL